MNLPMLDVWMHQDFKTFRYFAISLLRYFAISLFQLSDGPHCTHIKSSKKILFGNMILLFLALVFQKTKNMKKILFVSVILTILVACSSERVNFSQLQDRSGMFYLVNSDKPFSGEVVSYVGGRIEFEGKIQKGLREATWTYYYPNGQKKNEGNYKEGVKDGTWTYWKDNGTQEGLEVYKNNRSWRR